MAISVAVVTAVVIATLGRQRTSDHQTVGGCWTGAAPRCCIDQTASGPRTSGMHSVATACRDTPGRPGTLRHVGPVGRWHGASMRSVDAGPAGMRDAGGSMSSAYARRCAQTRRIPLSRQRDVHLTIESALRYGRSNDRLDDHPRDPSRDLSGDINPEVRVGGASPAGDAITNSSGKATVSPTSRASGVRCAATNFGPSTSTRA